MENTLIIKLFIYLIIIIIIGIFLKIRPNYREKVLHIFNDIITVYKNFVNWNISKIVLNIYFLLGWLIISSPVMALTIWFLYLTVEKLWSDNINLLSSMTLSWDIGLIFNTFAGMWMKSTLFIISLFLMIILLLIFIFAYLYSCFLLQIIYKKYLEGDKLFISKFASVSAILFLLFNFITWLIFNGNNPYIIYGSYIIYFIIFTPLFIFWILRSDYSFLNYRLIWKFFRVNFLTALYLVIPTILLLFVLILPQLSPLKELIWTMDYKSVIAFIVYFLLFLWVFSSFIYLGISVIFANMVLLFDTKNKFTKPWRYIKESMKITRWKTLEIIFLGAPFFLLSLIMTDLFDLIGGFYEPLKIWVAILDILLFSWIGFMIINSLYNIFNPEKEISIDTLEELNEEL